MSKHPRAALSATKLIEKARLPTRPRTNFQDSVDQKNRVQIDYEAHPKWNSHDFCWEVKGPIEADYKILGPRLHHELNQSVTESSWIVFVWPYMVGKSVEKAKPVIVVASEDKTSRKKAKSALEKSGILKEYSHFDLRSMRHLPSGPITLVAVEDDIVSTPSRFNSSSEVLFDPLDGIACVGLQIYVRYGETSVRRATANAVLNHGEFGYITAAHAFKRTHVDENDSTTDIERSHGGFDSESHSQEGGSDGEDDALSQGSDVSNKLHGSDVPSDSHSSLVDQRNQIRQDAEASRTSSLAQLPVIFNSRSTDSPHINQFESQHFDQLEVLGTVTASLPPFDSVVITVTHPGVRSYLAKIKDTRTNIQAPVLHMGGMMELFLKEWFIDDIEALKNISKGKFELQSLNKGIIHPRLWELVLEHDWHVTLWQGITPGTLLPPPPPPPAPLVHLPPSGIPRPPRDPDTENVHRTGHENRVQYDVAYFQQLGTDDSIRFVGRNTYDEPVEVQEISDDEALPVLQERKDVISRYDHGPEDFTMSGRSRPAKLDRYDEVGAISLVIHSPVLLNILRSIIDSSAEPPDGGLDGLKDGMFPYPFQDLYHHLHEIHGYKTDWEGLRSRHSSSFNEQADEHIDVLVNYLESQPTIPIKTWESNWASPAPTTPFMAVWLLLKPGTDVYVREADLSLNAYVVDKVTGGIVAEYGRRKIKDYVVTVWNLSFDGTRIVRRPRVVKVEVFDDKRLIIDLPVFPVSFIDGDDGVTLRKQLIERGKQYFICTKGPTYLQYTGKSLKKGIKSYKQARVIVEHASNPWLQQGFEQEMYPGRHPGVIIGQNARIPRCDCSTCKAESIPFEADAPKLKFSDYDNINPLEVEIISEHQYFLMSSHMFAFILKDRTYEFISVLGLEKPSILENAIDRLVMQYQSKDLIKAIAKVNTTGTKSELLNTDFIHGKGKGQIILLHGPPGTGKTLTAESIAEFTRRPLLSITAADLGHEPEAIERSLWWYLERGNEWNAIVLLDEADVFLEARSVHELRRNSIVSVFLRALEYFQGTIFLTSNRVAQFDEAILSRVTSSIFYEPLSEDARNVIWQGFFDRLRRDNKVTYEYDAKHYILRSHEVMDLRLNGREIRNAFKTAVTLAVFDSEQDRTQSELPELREDHFVAVIRMIKASREYMSSVYHGPDFAPDQGGRDDKYPSTRYDPRLE